MVKSLRICLHLDVDRDPTLFVHRTNRPDLPLGSEVCSVQVEGGVLEHVPKFGVVRRNVLEERARGDPVVAHHVENGRAKGAVLLLEVEPFTHAFTFCVGLAWLARCVRPLFTCHQRFCSVGGGLHFLCRLGLVSPFCTPFALLASVFDEMKAR